MWILLAFSFLAGIATVLSPCILPILPALLSAGTAGGRLRPFGIILGLLCSFSFFTLTLTFIVRATGISPDFLRYVAIVLIFLFGLVMLFPKLSDLFAVYTSKFSFLGQKLQKGGTGFWGGALFGVALGLLWTPCAGPILATITVLVATRDVTLTAVLMTVAYSLGAAIPLLIITYGSSWIIRSSRLLAKHAEGIRRVFGFLMIVVAVVLLMRWDLLLEQKFIDYLPQGFVEKNERLDEELKKLKGVTTVEGKAPEIVGIADWINSPPLTIASLQGKVVLIDFWTYSCINCLRTLPYIKKWDKEYRDQGLVIIGVHTPEFEFEKDLANVQKAVKQLGIQYPVALDNNYATWNAYHNRYWPAHYLIDKQGNIVMVHFGEGAYMETENAIRAQLGLAPLIKMDTSAQIRPQTPETYLGTARAEKYVAPIQLKPGISFNYSYTMSLPQDQVGLRGLWTAQAEYIESNSNESYIDLNFLGKQVYIVLAGQSDTPLQVFLDGKLVKEITVSTDRQYELVDIPYGRHLLALKVPNKIKAYVFTFGTE